MFAYSRINVIRSLSLIKSYAGFCYSRPFATKSDVGDSLEKCVVSDFPLLTEAVNTKNFELVSKIVTEQDPFEVRRIRIPTNNSRKSPNLIPSQSGRRMVGCICEPEADSINWLELEKGDPVQCYCGYRFQIVDFEDYFNIANQ
uniref:Cytochrome c oxidase subunit 5B n=1 Tax=Schistosoma japonicum TaxID=6182 RepID=Q5DAF2_SCHJA|nr:unknown [Schistosoma japonicum]